MSRLVAVALACTVGSSGCAADHRDVARADELADAERAFATSARTSVRDAFLAVLADDATLYRPGPVDGRAFTAAHPDGAFTLEWQPQRVAVSASGELGYSSGPYRLIATADPAHPSHGQFFTIWRRGPNGRWQVLFDLGNVHDEPVGWNAPFDAIVGDGSSPTRSLAEAEAAFARQSATAGAGAAYRAHGSTHLRLLRDDVMPLDGIAAASTLPASAEPWLWTVTGSGVSRAGDFAWTTGAYRAGAAASAPHGYFVRAWIVEARDWKILGDALAPIDDPIH